MAANTNPVSKMLDESVPVEARMPEAKSCLDRAWTRRCSAGTPPTDSVRTRQDASLRGPRLESLVYPEDAGGEALHLYSTVPQSPSAFNPNIFAAHTT